MEPATIAQPTSVKKTGADAIVESLMLEGVDILFGYPGGAIMPLYDSFYRYSEMIKCQVSQGCS